MRLKTKVLFFFGKEFGRLQFVLENGVEQMIFRRLRVGEKSTALADNAVDGKVVLKNAQAGFLLFECSEFGKIAWEILQKMEVVGDILLRTERIFCKQNRELRLDAERRTERFCKKACAARHFLAVQLVEQKIERDLVFPGEAVSVKGCERGFHSLQCCIMCRAVRD